MPLLDLAPPKTEPSVSATRFYRPELDVVRFFAFAAVFLHHVLPRDNHAAVLAHFNHTIRLAITGAASAFGFGLPLFFTLSAYLIGTLLLREKDRYDTVNLRSFYVRRILRIWPLYFLGIIVGCVVAIFSAKRPHDLLLFGSFLLMMGNWFSIVWHTPNPMMALWSISVEEQFYLFCPLLIKHLSTRHLYLFSATLILFSDFTLFFLGSIHADADRTIWYNSFVQFQMFGAGLLLCLILRRPKIAMPSWGRLSALAAGVASWLIGCVVFGVKQIGPARSGAAMVAGYTAGTIGCILILIAMLELDRKWLPGWMIWLGRVSFGLYVYHELSIWAVSHLLTRMHGYEHFVLLLITSATLTIFLTAISYRYLETPFLRLKAKFELVPSRTI